MTDGPLTHLVLFKLTDSARLFWCIHHLAVDGVSWRILQEDLHTAYTQIAAGQTLQLPAKTSSFKVWAEHLNAYAVSEVLSSERADWQALPSFSLPVDNPSGENRLEYQQDDTISLNRQETEALLREVPTAYNTHINDILLTALALALAKWTKQSRCLIDLEGHGRATLFDDIDLSRTVGWFTTIHPVALTLPSNSFDDLGAALKAIKEQLRAIPHEGIGYGLLTQMGGKVLPKGEILFNYLGQFDPGIEADLFGFAEETTSSDMSLKGPRDHLIDINGAISQGQLSLNWSYSADCWKAQTIKNLAESYKIHLQQLISHCQRGQQGVTPSDFPLVPVLPSTLDALYTQYPGLQDLYPLSPMQQGMLFHALYEPSSGVYFEQMQLTLSNLEPTAFKAAWQYQLERHPILRTAFLTEHQPILQVVQTEVPLLWREQDWRGMSSETQDLQLSALLLKERNQGFDLSKAPLMRFDLIRLSEQRYAFLWHHHHILMDGWCLPITFSEVRESYLAFKQGQTPQLPVRRPYRDYMAWLQQQDSTAAQHYWQQRLAGFITPTKLPIVNHKTENPDYHEIGFNAPNTQRLQQFCQTQRVTLNTLVQGAYALLLSRYSRESDICFGVTVSGRHASLSGIEQMIGLFINTLPLRIDVNPEYCVKDYLLSIQTQHQNDNRYAHSPLFEIQTHSGVPNGTALFDSLLVFENYPLGDALDSNAASYQIEDFQGIEYTNYPLTLAIIPGEVLSFKISYDNNRISQDSIERLWGHLKTLLTALASNPTQSISHLPMLTEKEVQQLQTWNDTATDYPKDLTLVDLFEQQVSITPDNIAVVFEQQQLSYRELNRKANQLAHYLLPFKNGNHDDFLIAIAVERSLEMVIGLLAILKAGGAYVPIDPSYPPDRIRYLLSDSAAPLLLTQSHLKAQLEPKCVVVCLDEVDVASQSSENPALRIQVSDLAYVIYTSGSTGKPKGVMVEHQALLNHMSWMQSLFAFTAKDKFLQKTPFSFDASVWEFYASLLTGGSLVLAKPQGHADINYLVTLLNQQQITVLQLVPSLLKAMLEENEAVPNSLRYLFCGGEALSQEIHRKFYSRQKNTGFYNLYGPTEACIDATCWKSKPLADISIGQPIANTRIYILSAQHQPQPPGIPGELCIAGRSLARGYLNRPELTSEKFLEVELFGKTERIYKTGDLARWLTDGNLEYLGRIDHQIKLRGFRIELGEIETVLRQQTKVKEAVVTLYSADDNKRLVAYLTTEKEPNDLVTELKETLKASLPDYMVPSHFTVLDKLPLTPNGKIDRKALPAPDSNTPIENSLPRDAIELQLLSVWENVLDVHPLGIHDNFFELGGHSLLAVKLMSHIQQHCGVRLPVSALFQSPTIATLAQQLHQDTSPLLTNLVPIQTAGEANPVYALPGAVGSVMYLYPLSSYLGQQQPFYALQTPGLDGSITPDTVEALASFHLQALQQQQPTGPYQLMGHSSGGRVAFEMAWQLEQQGETVAFLAILDTTAPDSNQPNPMADYTELNWLSEIVEVFEEMLGIELNLSLEQLRAMPEIEIAYAKVMQAFVERQIFFAPGAPVDELKALVNTYCITAQGHADYQIPGKLHCPIHLFRASEQMAESEFEDNREAWGWTDCTHAKVEEHWVPGTHMTMMALPHVKTLADKLAQYLRTEVSI
ncbi:pyoverdine sidechain peptide synthetase II, D-Asp-L-Thr component [Candidatus Thiomargarita nelsonii]|uniref:Pyoverdine sidechain peptide synthetase II, D-Asp-L-Thr component n=1 Tax=Candidatus Thiomargarita nelsonii TaxID=1003181 RepID=A0A176S1F8_9GAMM|nr:pyoverdine sidechain peptide synthetase II, D-Asp-L-Thr component [Candidatus Thiomargarita nelsonii]